MAYNFPERKSFENHSTDRQGELQLKYQHGSENDESFKVHNGNSDPGKGFGHVCISVDNIQAACQRIEDAGYRFKKKLSDGRMRNIAFVLDPDDYWVRLDGNNDAANPSWNKSRLKSLGRNHWNKLRILGRQTYKHINLYDPQNTEPYIWR